METNCDKYRWKIWQDSMALMVFCAILRGVERKESQSRLNSDEMRKVDPVTLLVQTRLSSEGSILPLAIMRFWTEGYFLQSYSYSWQNELQG
jgi:hypothetical protein